jgi:predicted transglutaminase-like cysteine proteinase
MSVIEIPTPPTSIYPANRPRVRPHRLRQTIAKALLFAAFTVLVLNPNLKRAFLQVGHVVHPESLIQKRFAAMAAINEQVDQVIVADAGQHSEARLVARFVLRNIRYVSDYANWGNLDYWPTAEETWQKRQEDCDGRAILAASILRARGFASADLVVGLDHMWILVDENEKEASKPAHYVALLSPNPDFSLKVHERSGWSDLASLAKAFLHPTAFCETSSHLLADIPDLRKAILITALLFLCAFPCRNRWGLPAVLGLGLAAACLLAQWHPDKGPLAPMIYGNLLLLLALAGALTLDRLTPFRPASIPPRPGS